MTAEHLAPDEIVHRVVQKVDVGHGLVGTEVLRYFLDVPLGNLELLERLRASLEVLKVAAGPILAETVHVVLTLGRPRDHPCVLDVSVGVEGPRWLVSWLARWLSGDLV